MIYMGLKYKEQYKYADKLNIESVKKSKCQNVEIQSIMLQMKINHYDIFTKQTYIQ